MIIPEKRFMREAIETAKRARAAGDYAIGAVVVRDGEILASTTNHTKIDNDPTQHAEVATIREATKKLGTRYLEGAVLYTTHEPCPMCASAAVWGKLAGIVFGASIADMENYRLKNGNNEWTWRTINISARDVLAKGDPRLELVEGFMREECCELFHSV